MHIRQPEVPSLEAERQACMIDAEQVQDRRLQIVDVDRIADDVVAEVVGLAVGCAGAAAAAGHPDREAAAVMIAAVSRLREIALYKYGAAELAGPDQERGIGHAGLSQILLQ